jgi:hypothetical protein
MALDVADTRVAERDQVLGDLLAGAEVVDAHAGDVLLEARRSDRHHRGRRH